jgi:hypothetical protein
VICNLLTHRIIVNGCNAKRKRQLSSEPPRTASIARQIIAFSLSPCGSRRPQMSGRSRLGAPMGLWGVWASGRDQGRRSRRGRGRGRVCLYVGGAKELPDNPLTAMEKKTKMNVRTPRKPRTLSMRFVTCWCMQFYGTGELEEKNQDERQNAQNRQYRRSPVVRPRRPSGRLDRAFHHPLNRRGVYPE